MPMARAVAICKIIEVLPVWVLSLIELAMSFAANPRRAQRTWGERDFCVGDRVDNGNRRGHFYLAERGHFYLAVTL